MNNRETAAPDIERIATGFAASPDRCDPQGERDQRHDQRQADQFGRSIAPAGRQSSGRRA